jgi:hypothetical protein
MEEKGIRVAMEIMAARGTNAITEIRGTMEMVEMGANLNSSPQ